MNNSRILKIRTKWIQKTAHSRERFVPQIDLSGKWLEEAGFIIGNDAYIEVTGEGLLIRHHPQITMQQDPQSLAAIQAAFIALNIPIERKVKK